MEILRMIGIFVLFVFLVLVTFVGVTHEKRYKRKR